MGGILRISFYWCGVDFYNRLHNFRKNGISQMKKLLAILVLTLTSLVHADYRFIVPQEPGAGTSVWTTIVTRELEKKLGEKIYIQHIPGARDIPGPTKFQEELRFDNKTVMVAHGGNAESFLLEKVTYNYKDWDPIGAMNITIMVGRRTDSDVYKQVKFAAGSGNNPDMIAMTLLICGPMADLKAYGACYKDKAKFINGMSAPERRLAYMRGELNSMRETPAAYNKFFIPMKDNTNWFNEGILDINTGKVVADTNYDKELFFETVYKKKWGVAPKGDLFDAYMLVKNWRDVLQKSMWVNKGNPNADKLRAALRAMMADPVAMAAIEKDNGKYEFLVGNDVNKAMTELDKLTTKKALKDLVWWSSMIFGIESYYKEDIARKAH